MIQQQGFPYILVAKRKELSGLQEQSFQNRPLILRCRRKRQDLWRLC